MILTWETAGFDLSAARGDRGRYEIAGLPFSQHSVHLDEKMVALCANETIARSVAQGFENRAPHVIAYVKACYAAMGDPYPFDD